MESIDPLWIIYGIVVCGFIGAGIIWLRNLDKHK